MEKFARWSRRGSQRFTILLLDYFFPWVSPIMLALDILHLSRSYLLPPGPWLHSTTFISFFPLSLSLFVFFSFYIFLTRPIFGDKFRSPKLPEKSWIKFIAPGGWRSSSRTTLVPGLSWIMNGEKICTTFLDFPPSPSDLLHLFFFFFF